MKSEFRLKIPNNFTDVKVLFKYNQNTQDILLLIWLSNDLRYNYFKLELKIDKGSHILPIMKNFPEIGLNYSKIYHVG